MPIPRPDRSLNKGASKGTGSPLTHSEDTSLGEVGLPDPTPSEGHPEPLNGIAALPDLGNLDNFVLPDLDLEDLESISAHQQDSDPLPPMEDAEDTTLPSIEPESYHSDEISMDELNSLLGIDDDDESLDSEPLDEPNDFNVNTVDNPSLDEQALPEDEDDNSDDYNSDMSDELSKIIQDLEREAEAERGALPDTDDEDDTFTRYDDEDDDGDFGYEDTDDDEESAHPTEDNAYVPEYDEYDDLDEINDMSNDYMYDEGDSSKTVLLDNEDEELDGAEDYIAPPKKGRKKKNREKEDDEKEDNDDKEDKKKSKPKSGQSKSVVKKLLSPILWVYKKLSGLVFGVITWVLGILGALPLIGKPFQLLNHLVKSVRGIAESALGLILIVIIGGWWFLSVPSSDKAELPDNVEVTVSNMNYDEETGTLTGEVMNDSPVIAEVTVTASIRANAPQLNPLTWVAARTVGTCEPTDLLVEIDETKEFTVSCDYGGKGLFPRPTATIEG